MEISWEDGANSGGAEERRPTLGVRHDWIGVSRCRIVYRAGSDKVNTRQKNKSR
jgi:hypothetical protein